MNLKLQKAVLAGIAGTAAMTAVGIWLAPAMGLPRMNPAEMLAAAMRGMMLLGWVAHFMIGIVLAASYALVAARLPGPAAVRGALYAILPWIVAQTVVVPMMGMPLFSGSAVMAGESLVGHLVYGLVVGVIYGVPERALSSVASRSIPVQ